MKGGTHVMICTDCRLSAHAVLSVLNVGRICVPCFIARKREQNLTVGQPAAAQSQSQFNTVQPQNHPHTPTMVVSCDEPVTYAAQAITELQAVS